ncbi:MAG: hypothetical protein AAF632_19520 [Bacteroidota bacterium]
MKLDELKPDWQHYALTTATQEQRSLDGLDALLPAQQSTFNQWFTSYSSLLRNAAMYAFIIIFCGGC